MLSNSLLEKRAWAKEFEIEGMRFKDVEWAKKGAGLLRGVRSRLHLVGA